MVPPRRCVELLARGLLQGVPPALCLDADGLPGLVPHAPGAPDELLPPLDRGGAAGPAPAPARRRRDGSRHISRRVLREGGIRRPLVGRRRQPGRAPQDLPRALQLAAPLLHPDHAQLRHAAGAMPRRAVVDGPARTAQHQALAPHAAGMRRPPALVAGAVAVAAPHGRRPRGVRPGPGGQLPQRQERGVRAQAPEPRVPGGRGVRPVQRGFGWLCRVVLQEGARPPRRAAGPARW
mmetsp:Transcript_117952/g.334476  ORF Transcript_117952/g.334476 Transcript_117952/m.334476 type:complete len:236 (+) Transcript_117952:300-1007(+)